MEKFMKHLFVFWWALLNSLFLCYAQSDHILWYNKPACYFEESLPLGNGKVGASIFGGVASEKIYLNDATLWSGEPVNPDMNPNAHSFIPFIREALKNGEYCKADSLNKMVQGKFSESYAPLGTLYIDSPDDSAFTDYRRELDIRNALATVSYNTMNGRVEREYLISHPDKIMAVHVDASAGKLLHFVVHFSSLLKYTVRTSGNELIINGYAPWHAEPSYRGDIPHAVCFNENRGTRFSAVIRIMNTDGKVACTDSALELKNANKAEIRIAIETSFNSFQHNPATDGKDVQALVKSYLNSTEGKSYEALKHDHKDDYQRYFNRVKFDLGATTAPDMPTDERLIRYSEGKEDKNLEVLYFQYGRYLLISSSRTAGVPANLQGIWNPYLRPPWSSNYTLNINVEENYWLAEIANLSEMHLPLLDYIENLAVTGEITARNFYGVSGWCAAHNSDIWAMSNPVGDFGTGDPCWANWNMGGAWLSSHLWEHYQFTQDLHFLRTKAYPLMKGAAQFCLEWLTWDIEGKLITSPSTSPENLYKTPQGYSGATMFGGTADLAMIRELFGAVSQASLILDSDAVLRKQIEQALGNLHPYKIGKKGNLQEWYYDWEDADPTHRHQSHLFGLFPGHQISPQESPELANACKKSLEIKGDQTTGWSKGWRINLWARLGDGNHAYKMVRELLSYVPPDGMNTNKNQGGGTYPNLFDAHPPFQIDGNFGGSAAFIEMLMQSKGNDILLLPALPDAWSEGSIEGICARGGYEISLAWSGHKLQRVNIKGRKGGLVKLHYKTESREVMMKENESVEILWR